ncbi:MAG: ParB/RepB/Spo0J family partition protein [Desulfuromonadales bacterium]|nr:ParB/RepB/Spo0J family partition protein [Desulfuromonadales bacterium]
MPVDFNKRSLKNLTPDEIYKNPENPRIIFRQEEMENLMLSISKLGIQVPVAVYKDGGKYYLLDGERRWRCSKKLNLRTIPALVQEKPSPLENLLLMYNIHALREQWDYFTIASKLQTIVDLYVEEKGYPPNEVELSEETGLGRGQIRRCRLLLDLPERFKEMLLEELKLPKSQQKISEDFFIEMERSLKTVTNRIPEFAEDIDTVRDTLVEKFRNNTIGAVTDFRQLSKIATSIEGLGVDEKKAKSALDRIFDQNSRVGIRQMFKDTVEFEYDEKNAERHVSLLSDYFDEIIEDNLWQQLDEKFIDELRELHARLTELLGG